MSIGIEDADIVQYTLVPFNLECMKLSAYYKKSKEIVVLAPDFMPERHTKFIYRKDYDDGIYPPNLLTTPNVEYGGLAFSNNIYKPLPLDVERMKPDTTLYQKMERKIVGNGSANRKKIFNNMINCEHLRISLDGKTIWPEYTKQLGFLPQARNIMFHDFDLNQIKDGFECVQDILKHARTDGWATRVGMKFPVKIYNGKDLLNWSSLRTNSTFFSFEYYGVIDWPTFYEWIGNVKERAVYKTLNYYVTEGPYTENQFIKEQLPQILKQVIFSRSYHIFFSLKYDTDFFSDKRWVDVLRLFNLYAHSAEGMTNARAYTTSQTSTIFDFASYSKNIPVFYMRDYMTRDEIREVFRFVSENQPELFELFYKCSAETLGGEG